MVCTQMAIVRVQLSPYLHNCPAYWKNFFADMDHKHANLTNLFDLNDELESYKAKAFYRIEGDKEIPIILFENEEAYSFFLLRWL